MTSTPDPAPARDPRASELIAAAAADDLTPAEAEEYADLAAADATVAAETAELRGILERVARAGPWQEAEPAPELTARILAIPHGVDGTAGTPGRSTAPPRRGRVLAGLLAAAVLLVVGGIGGSLVDDWLERPPEGGPGTLGAVEPISFEVEPEGVEIDASLVAHTWGTETVLDMDGWVPGDRYAVVLVGLDGTVEDSGTFLGSTVHIDCAMNAALLREEVDLVEIRDDRGRVVARSDVPAVGA